MDERNADALSGMLSGLGNVDPQMLSGVLSGVLSNPEALSGVLSLVKSLSGNGAVPPKEVPASASVQEESVPAARILPPPPHPQHTPKPPKPYGKEKDLLCAMKPFLSPEKCRTVDRIAMMLDLLALMEGGGRHV